MALTHLETLAKLKSELDAAQEKLNAERKRKSEWEISVPQWVTAWANELAKEAASNIFNPYKANQDILKGLQNAQASLADATAKVSAQEKVVAGLQASYNAEANKTPEQIAAQDAAATAIQQAEVEQQGAFSIQNLKSISGRNAIIILAVAAIIIFALIKILK